MVAVDQAEGATLATRHLLDLGHKTVHHITGPLSSIESQLRAGAWRATLEAAGAPRPEPLIGDWSARAGYHLGRRLSRDRSMTAVFVANDQMALGPAPGPATRPGGASRRRSAWSASTTSRSPPISPRR